MGKTEKIVVLSVLFAIVVLFVWSLDQGEPQASAGGAGAGARPSGAPAGGTSQQQSAAKVVKPTPQSPSRTNEGTPATAPPSGGLTSRVDQPTVKPRPHPDELGGASAQGPLLISEMNAPKRSGVVLKAEWDLVSLEGLETTVDPETFVGTARAGDTWATLAVRYYGDASRALLLQRANEGLALREDVAFFAPAVDTLPKTPEVREVEVLEGEGLWNVAKRALGNGNRWRELFETNRDRIPNPDFVKPGTLLRLP